MDPKKDYYAVLGVDPTASVAEMHAAWLRLIEQHHPDRWVQYGEERARQATRRTQEINEAWQTLNDERGRLEYDRLRALRLLEAVGWHAPVFRHAPEAADLVDFESTGRPPAPWNGAPGDVLTSSHDSLTEVAGPPRHTPWGPRTVFGVAALALLAYVVIVVASIAVLTAIKGADPSSTQQIVALLIGTMALDYTIVMFAFGFGPRKWRLGFGGLGFRSFSPSALGLALAGVLMAWAILIAYGILVQVAGLDELLPKSTLQDDVFNDPLTIVVAGLATVVVAPLAEEAFFRGFVFAGLLPRLGLWPAAAISGAMFSVAHLEPGSLLPFALVGMVLAWLYYRTNTLWTAVAMHFAFNLLSYSFAVAANR